MLKKISFGLVAFGFATQVMAAPLTMGQIYNYAKKGDLQSLRNVVKHIDSVGKDGNTNLCRAVYNNDYKAFNALKTAGASVQHACVKKIPAEKIKAFNEGYANWAKGMNASAKVATGTTTAETVATTTGLSTGAMVGIGVGAVALIGGGIALAAGGGGGGGSSAPACSGHGTQDTEGLCVCDTGYAGDNCETCAGGFINQGGVCYAELGCVNGTQNKDKCDCRNGWNGTLCETANACEGYETSCPVGYAQSATCQRGDTPVYQCNNCASGYIKLNGVCVEEMDCNHGTQTGDRTCSCNQGWGGDVCNTCAEGYGHHGDSHGCYLTLTCDYTKVQERDKCVCNANYPHEYNGECYTPLSCGTNEIQQGDTCVCKDGYDKIDGVCTLTACPAGTYKSGSNCVSCPANSTSPTGSTSADQCTCVSGYKKAGDLCVPNTQSGKIFKFGSDVGSSSHVISVIEDLTISKPNIGTADENEALIAMYDGATLVNNGKLTASTEPDTPKDYDELPLGYIAIDSYGADSNNLNYITNNGTINGRSVLRHTVFENSESGVINFVGIENLSIQNQGMYAHQDYSALRAIETSTIINKGNINVTNGYGISVEGNKSPYKDNGIYAITNYGTITHTGESNAAVWYVDMEQDAIATIDNYGTITSTNGLAVQAIGNVTVSNYKTINGFTQITGAGATFLNEGTLTGDLFLDGAKSVVNNGTINGQVHGNDLNDESMTVAYFENNGTIQPTGRNGLVEGGIWVSGGKVVNNGTIHIPASGAGISGKNAIIENYGNIVVEADGVGIFADGGSVYNAGTITIDGITGDTAYNLDNLEYPDKDNGERLFIALHNGATLATSGTIDAGTSSLNTASFSSDGTGKVKALPGVKLASQKSVEGNVYISNDFVTNNFDTTVVAKDMIQTPDASKLNLISESVLFNASLAENGKDVVMTMKGFDTATDNKSLSDFLTHNYAMGNNEGFFNKLKGFGDVGSLTAGLNSLTGQDMLSRFNFEDMTMMRELNFDMNDKLFHNKEQSFSVAGSVSPMAFKGDTGSNARYSLFNKRQGKFSLGLGVAFTDVRSDDDHNDNARSETMYQLVVPMGYKTHGFNLVTSPRLGYARGSYDRTGFEGKNYDGTIEKRMFGLMNEARYPMTFGDWSVEPSAEFNVIGYQQKGSEDTKEYSLNIKNQNTYSVEGGFGLYLNKVKELAKDKTLKLNLGASVYHEFADPYQLEVGLTGMDGSFMLRDEERSDNRAVIRAGFDYAEEDYSIYGSFISYIDREIRTALKSGFKWKF